MPTYVAMHTISSYVKMCIMLLLYDSSIWVAEDFANPINNLKTSALKGMFL